MAAESIEKTALIAARREQALSGRDVVGKGFVDSAKRAPNEEAAWNSVKQLLLHLDPDFSEEHPFLSTLISYTELRWTAAKASEKSAARADAQAKIRPLLSSLQESEVDELEGYFATITALYPTTKTR